MEPVESFAQIHRRCRALVESLKSFRANFTETTTSSLLVQPIVARGTMVGSKPIRLLLNYESPEKKTVLFDGNRFHMVWPDRGEEEELNITKPKKAIEKYITSASEEDLRGHFDIDVLVDPDFPHTYLIDMRPRSKLFKGGLARFQLWLERETLFMARVHIVFSSGDTKLIELDGVRHEQ